MAPKIPDSDSEMEIEEPKPSTSSKHFSGSGSKASSSSAAASKKKREYEVVELSSDSDADIMPKKKKAAVSSGAGGRPRASTSAPKKDKAAAGKKKKSKDDDYAQESSSSEEDDDKGKAKDEEDSDEDIKPKKKKSPDGAVGKGKAKEKEKAPPKKAPAKSAAKPKKEDDGEEAKPKFKWQPKPKTGPVAPGSKEIPIGEPNCLAGLTFVFTGELESLSREEAQDLAKRYGGRVTTTPSSKTSYVVLGSDAGPSKLKKIEQHKIKTLDEDGFLSLIGNNKSREDDPEYKKQVKKEQDKVKQDAKSMTLAKDAPEHLTQLWTTKYAPTKLNEICGNKGHVEKLATWLEHWPKSLASNFKKPGPNAMNTFRCVLISGPPGIGKTTSAHLIAKMQGYDILELNASDTRSKKLLEEAFRSKISDTTLSGFFKAPGGSGEGEGLGVNKKSLIIMDEVDGMSAGDRGGVGALNALIKKSKVPIIAIANDSKSQKMKPLLNTCFQMLFKRPTAQEIRSRIMTIAFKESLKLDGKVVDQLVAGSQADIRQIINMLATYKLSQKALDYDAGKKLVKMNEKNALQTPWTLYGKIFGPQAFSPVSGMTLTDKLEV
ncbi:hypothetical protein JCM10207_004487, partial [Rhodosporidiobolus poonsookiae]